MSNKAHQTQKTQSPDLSLTPDQQELLLTALSSNRSNPVAINPNYFTKGSNTVQPGATNPNSNTANFPMPVDSTSTNSMAFQSPLQTSPSSGKSSSGKFDQSPFLDYDLDDGNFDWDNTGESLFGNLPEAPNEDEGDLHDKRKNPEDERDGDENGGKRREGEDRSAKKPGRKPLTGEPTTKRKAQNRAAQRAFRERKERHLKDLETKVEDLEKVSEATNHENGRLRAQVDRLNTELKEYRKRLSLNGTGGGRSPPSAASFSQTRNFYNNSNDIQFAFPKFGDLPGSNFISNGSLAKVASPNRAVQPPESSPIPGILRTQSSSSIQAESPSHPNGSIKFGSPDQVVYPSPTNSANDFEELRGLFSPSILDSVSRGNSTDYMNMKNTRTPSYPENQGSGSRVPANSSVPFNTSPSVSSMSNNGLDSSCGTTPEPSADSPDNRKGSEGVMSPGKEESADYNKTASSLTITKSPMHDVNGIDWMAQQNGGQFDPVLFGDYRDPHESILSSFDPDFFNDAFDDRDFSTPFYTGEPTSPAARRDLMKEIEVQQNGAVDETAPSNKPKIFLGCDKIWDRLQGSTKVQAGDIDVNDLCAQLKAKAKCSGSGAVIDEKDVEDILGPELSSQKVSFSMFS